MKGRCRLLWPGVLLALLAASPGAAPANNRGSADRDVAAIQELLEKATAVAGDPKLSLEQKAEASRAMHRPDSSYSKEDLPVYFGPTSHPVLHGADAYIDAVLRNLAWYERQGYRFETRLREMQITVEKNLAVAVVQPSGVIVSPKGQTLGEAPGRWTVVLQKGSDGKWYIVHEHMSFYNERGGAGFNQEQLDRALQGLKPGS